MVPQIRPSFPPVPIAHSLAPTIHLICGNFGQDVPAAVVHNPYNPFLSCQHPIRKRTFCPSSRPTWCARVLTRFIQFFPRASTAVRFAGLLDDSSLSGVSLISSKISLGSLSDIADDSEIQRKLLHLVCLGQHRGCLHQSTILLFYFTFSQDPMMFCCCCFN